VTLTPRPEPEHFRGGLERRALRPIADEHPIWRLIGAWIAARQRGDAEAIRPFVLADPARAEGVLADARALIEKGGGPLKTGAELDVEAKARHDDDGKTLREVAITLKGKVEDPEPRTIVSRLFIAEAVDEGGQWFIASLLDASSRAVLADANFLTLLEHTREAGDESP